MLRNRKVLENWLTDVSLVASVPVMLSSLHLGFPLGYFFTMGALAIFLALGLRSYSEVFSDA